MISPRHILLPRQIINFLLSRIHMGDWSARQLQRDSSSHSLGFKHEVLTVNHRNRIFWFRPNIGPIFGPNIRPETRFGDSLGFENFPWLVGRYLLSKYPKLHLQNLANDWMKNAVHFVDNKLKVLQQISLPIFCRHYCFMSTKVFAWTLDTMLSHHHLTLQISVELRSLT